VTNPMCEDEGANHAAGWISYIVVWMTTEGDNKSSLFFIVMSTAQARSYYTVNHKKRDIYF